ncbi:serine/threonine-protein kinase-like protein At3g51990 [Magnolia sinica]|uniref:serine/threonine-protein kinase-like protein At3g51990 n=1 Tax=Magnolia sinica TaxID=86752 RepID=UPI0026582D84|nr:serine/threonine-protein kinase-like protein At3g51990 [Magnolia sinica]
MELSYKDIEIATKGFAIESLIGKGSHGCVYKGVLKGGKTVAVKKPSKGLQLLQDNSKLDNEIEILSSIQSPHIVNLLGVVHEDSVSKLLIMEFMPNGSLEDFLHNASGPPTWIRRSIMALHIARAIQYLHETTPLVIHRDIKSANILLDSKWNVKLADFSLAVKGHSHICNGLIDTTSANGSDQPIISRAIPAGTMGYLDPCYTTPGRLSTKNDVFSFGVVLLEIIICRRAMDVGFEPASLVDWALPLIKADRIMEVCDYRVALPNSMKGVIRCMLNVAARCVSSSKEGRPSMGEIVMELESVVGHTQFSVWRLVRSSFLRRRCPYFSPKRKQTRTIICKIDEADDASQDV